MKKVAKKLALNRETLKSLLAEKDLKNVVGGTLLHTATNCNISWCICD